VSESEQGGPGETPVLTLRVHPSLTSWLSQLAAEHGTTRSDLVRAALQRVTPAELWGDAPAHLAAGTAVAAQVLESVSADTAHPGAGEAPGVATAVGRAPGASGGSRGSG